MYIFCEGARGDHDAADVLETRRVVRELTLGLDVEIEERVSNLGCSQSIRCGIDKVLETSDRVVVLEDDLVVSRYFLRYMNAALEQYKDSVGVMHISGFMHAVDLSEFPTAQFFPFTNPWGWGTWRRAWQRFDRDFSGSGWALRYWYRRFRLDFYGAFQLRKAILLAQAGEITDWDTKWALTVFRSAGLSLFPRVSLVSNTGFDGSGSHEMEARFDAAAVDVSSNREDALPERIEFNSRALKLTAFVLSGERGWTERIMGHLRGRWGWRESVARIGGEASLRRAGYVK